MNTTLKTAAQDILIGLLNQCTPGQQNLFKRMYCFKNVEKSIEYAVMHMDESKMDWAISQCERTIEKNKKEHFGPRGGRFYINSNGNKEYFKK
jgi:hypothetical protein